MRIVHLTHSTITEVTGGLEYHIAYLADALKERGHEIVVVNMAATFGGATTVETQPSPGNAVRQRISRRQTSAVAALRHQLDVVSETLAMFARRVLASRHAGEVARHVESLQPDLVHQHSYLDGLGACLLLSRKFPVVFTNHTGAYLHLDRFAPTRWLQRQLMRKFTMVIGPSRELLPATENSHYVSNGVDTARFAPLSAEERDRLKTKHQCAGRRVFLCPRRWAPTKGIIYLAEALRFVSKTTRESSVFLFSGNDTPGYARYQENVRQALAMSGCEVRTLGNLGHVDLAELMGISEACVIPSLMEATSLACLEAMACGTPVLGTETGGLLELIRPGVNGWLVPLRDPQALAAVLDEIVRAGDLAALRDGAVATVRERYTWKAAAEITEGIYESALQKWRATPERSTAGQRAR